LARTPLGSAGICVGIVPQDPAAAAAAELVPVVVLEPALDAEAELLELELDFDELPQPATASNAVSIAARTSTFLSLSILPLSPSSISMRPRFWTANTVQRGAMYPNEEHHVKSEPRTHTCR
jgi:hypothetical protein